MRLLVIGKARQVGLSYALCIISLWLAKFRQNAKVLMLSQGEEEAFDLVARCRFIDNNLPDYLRGKRDPDQRGFLGFPATNSEIRALPSTDKAGRSTDATLVVCDEWEFHEYAEENFAALKPTIDAGGKFIALSTGDPTRLDTYFKKKYNESKSGFSQFQRMFVGALERPGRDMAWLEGAIKDLSSIQRQGEYPLTEDDMLTVLKTRRVFDQDRLLEMRAQAVKPIKHELSDKYRDIVKIFRPCVVGNKYYMFTDPSDGKEDPFASTVFDFQTGFQMASARGKIPADRCAVIHDELAREYRAFNSYELNARAGGIFSEKLKALETPNQCPFIDNNWILSDKGKQGWWTDKNKKDKIIWGLEEAVRLNQIQLNDTDFIDELINIIQPEGEEPMAPSGGHDDCMIACGAAWQIRKYVPIGAGTVKSYAYRRG